MAWGGDVLRCVCRAGDEGVSGAYAGCEAGPGGKALASHRQRAHKCGERRAEKRRRHRELRGVRGWTWARLDSAGPRSLSPPCVLTGPRKQKR